MLIDKKRGFYIVVFAVCKFLVNNKYITFVVKDLITGIADTLNVKDSGSLLTGGTGSINGIQGEGDVIFFDDFKIEKYE